MQAFTLAELALKPHRNPQRMRRMWKPCARLLFLSVIWIWVSACAPPPASYPEGALPPDDRGHRPGLSTPPQRLVVLSPSITEILFHMGAGDRIVGVSRFCLWPEEAGELPRVGGGMDPNPEAVLRLSPDLILSSGSQAPPALRRLEELGIPVVLLDHHSLDKVLSDIMVLGKWLGMEEPSRELVASMESDRDSLAHRVAGQPGDPRTAVILYGFNELLSAGRGSFPSDLVQLAGGINRADEIHSPWPLLNEETLLRWDPDFIIFSLHGSETDDEVKSGLSGFARDPRWRSLRAVTQGNLHAIEDSLLAIPGPRSLPAALRLYEIFHGEAERP